MLFPTPPFWFAIAMIRALAGPSEGADADSARELDRDRDGEGEEVVSATTAP